MDYLSSETMSVRTAVLVTEWGNNNEYVLNNCIYLVSFSIRLVEHKYHVNATLSECVEFGKFGRVSTDHERTVGNCI